MELLRPVRLAAVPSRRLAQGDIIVTFCHPEPCEGALLEYRQDLNRDPSTSLRFAQDDNEGESHFSIIKLRAQKSHFLQAPPICRKPSAQFGKSECAALLQGRAFKARGAERKTNAEPRFIAANIRLSLRSRKKVLSLSKLFS